jgi:hypothetical protein
MTRPLCSTPITGASSLLRAGPPAHLATVLTPRLRPGYSLSLPNTMEYMMFRQAVSRRAFPRFLQEPQTRLMPPQCRTPPGQKLGIRQALLPQLTTRLRFRCHSTYDDTSTAVRGYSSSWSPPDTSGVPFPHRSPRRSSANAACGGLKPPPNRRLRRAKPSSLAEHRIPLISPTFETPFLVRGTRGDRGWFGAGREPLKYVLKRSHG